MRPLVERCAGCSPARLNPSSFIFGSVHELDHLSSITPIVIKSRVQSARPPTKKLDLDAARISGELFIIFYISRNLGESPNGEQNIFQSTTKVDRLLVFINQKGCLKARNL